MTRVRCSSINVGISRREMIATLLLVGCIGGVSASLAGEPLDLVPGETLLCWRGRPLPDTAPAGEPPSAIATLLDLGTRFAGQPLDRRTQLNLRILETFGLMIRYPHALALIDAEARPSETNASGRKVDQLRMVLVVQTNGQSDAFRRVIQKVVNEQTDAEAASLERRKAGRWTYQELHDKRLPDWCQIAWGDIDDCFVLSLGDGVWPLIARVAAGEANSLSRDDWLSRVRGERGRDALIELVVANRTIRQRLDPFLNGRATDFFKAWHAEDIDRAHWALGMEGRALYCVAHFLRDGKDDERIFADPRIDDARLIATIPPSARYAIYRVPMKQMIPRFFAGLLATRDGADRQRAQELWEKIQKEHGFDYADVVDNLGDYWVLHNDPPHPLHIPLALTSLLEIRDEPQRVRKTFETMCRAWKEGWDRAAEKGDIPNPATLHRDEDGVWYVKFGPIAGPGWTITDRFIISSWSPAALRSYLEKIGDAVGRRASE